MGKEQVVTTYSVRVRRGPFSGMGSNGCRLNILPGTYIVEHIGNTLIFANADKKIGGNIVVDLDDYKEIGTFPNDISQNTQIELV